MSHGFEVVEEWSGWAHDEATNEDKLWAGCFTTDGWFISVWGRRDTRYNPTFKKFATQQEAGVWFNKKLAEKRRKRYQSVPFSQDDRVRAVMLADGRYTLTGAVPTFRIENNQWLMALASQVAKDGEITFDTLLDDMRRLAGLLQKSRMSDFDIEYVLTTYQTISIKVSVWTEFHGGNAARDIKEYFNQLEALMEERLLAI